MNIPQIFSHTNSFENVVGCGTATYIAWRALNKVYATETAQRIKDGVFHQFTKIYEFEPKNWGLAFAKRHFIPIVGGITGATLYGTRASGIGFTRGNTIFQAGKGFALGIGGGQVAVEGIKLAQWSSGKVAQGWKTIVGDATEDIREIKKELEHIAYLRSVEYDTSSDYSMIPDSTIRDRSTPKHCAATPPQHPPSLSRNPSEDSL